VFFSAALPPRRLSVSQKQNKNLSFFIFLPFRAHSGPAHPLCLSLCPPHTPVNHVFVLDDCSFPQGRDGEERKREKKRRPAEAVCAAERRTAPANKTHAPPLSLPAIRFPISPLFEQTNDPGSLLLSLPLFLYLQTPLNNNNMAPPPPAADAPPPPAAPAALPRSNTAVKNLSALCACCRDPQLEADPVQHPHAPFMARAIELSRIGGIEKRTGGCFGAVVVRNGVVSSFSCFRSAAKRDQAGAAALLFSVCLSLSLSSRRSFCVRVRGAPVGTADDVPARALRARELRELRERRTQHFPPFFHLLAHQPLFFYKTSADRRRGLQQRRQLQRPHVVSRGRPRARAAGRPGASIWRGRAKGGAPSSSGGAAAPPRAFF